MKWSELIQQVATRTGLSNRQVKAVIDATLEVAQEAIGAGERVALPGIGTFHSRWQPARVVRAVSDQRRMRLDGRYVLQFRSAEALRERLMKRTPQSWREPGQQAAWRLAEALLSEIEMYHQERVPRFLPESDQDAEALLSRNLGQVWVRARQVFDHQTPAEARAGTDHLLQLARERWHQAS